MSSYQEKLDAAKSIIAKHNENVEEADQIVAEDFVKSLKKIGGTTVEALIACKYEHIEKLGIPALIAAQICNIFRKTNQPAVRKAITEKKALVMTARELFEHYDPREKNPVWLRLYALCEGKRCVVFNDDGKVNKDVSADLVNEIRDEEEPRDVVVINGKPYKTHNIGHRLDSFVDENPLYPGTALRGSDQVCNETTRSWKEVPRSVRIALRLALETGELKILQLGDAHNVFDMLLGKTEDEAVALVSQRYIKAALRYQELDKEGNLPKLKLKRGQKALRVSKKQDPFYGRGHRTY